MRYKGVSLMSKFDVVVVGAGTAGSIVARRLADAGKRVLIIEAGGDNRRGEIQDVGRAHELWHTDRDWDFYTTPQEHAHGRRLHFPRGRVLGGSHSLNGAIWIRGHASDYDGWAADGATGWSWADVEPVFRRIEGWTGDPAGGRGTDGLLPIEDNAPLHPVQASVIDAAVQAGLSINPDHNLGDTEGIASQQVTIKDGDRVTTWDAYAKPALDAGRLEVRSGLRAVRVVVVDGAATGVEVLVDGVTELIEADQVVLCAGTEGTTELLLRSGIGPAAQLEALGITSVADLPVGENLHDHWVVPVIFTTTTPIVPTPKLPVTQVHWFSRTDPALPAPDTQPIAFSVPLLEPGMAPIPWGLSIMAGLVRTYSRGTIRLASARVEDGILIDPQVLADDRDVQALLASVRQSLAVGAQPALAEEWGAVAVYPTADISDADLIEYIRQNVSTYHHQVGTCRIGTDERAVVDPTLRVRGITGLMIADGSVMPTVTTGNTNAPIAMIGERAADFLLA
jgi:choline dehydrogenase-like flavoprotein